MGNKRAKGKERKEKRKRKEEKRSIDMEDSGWLSEGVYN